MARRSIEQCIRDILTASSDLLEPGMFEDMDPQMRTAGELAFPARVLRDWLREAGYFRVGNLLSEELEQSKK